MQLQRDLRANRHKHLETSQSCGNHFTQLLYCLRILLLVFFSVRLLFWAYIIVISEIQNIKYHQNLFLIMDDEQTNPYRIVRNIGVESARAFRERRKQLEEKYNVVVLQLSDPHIRNIGTFDPILQKWVDWCHPVITDGVMTGYRKPCSRCGEEFETTDPRRKYCSGECKKKVFIEARRKKTPQPREQRCLNCGGIIEARRGAKFCAHRCQQAYWRKKNERIKK